MKSIAARFTASVVGAIIFSVAVIGAISLYTLVVKADADAATSINLTCENEAQQINSVLEDIERSVDIEVSYALDNLDDPKRFFEDEEYRAAFTSQMEGLFANVARGTNGAVSYYFRYNAADIPSTQGFLYGRESAESDFARIELTDLSLYDPGDNEHVGWYYIPLGKGSATWLLPYHNKNLGIYMISYVVPVYAANRFIGVIGMDVNFQVVVDQLELLHPFTSGFAALMDPDGTVYYHPAIAYGAKLDGSDASLPDIHSLLDGDSSAGKLVAYQFGGQEKRFAYQALLNGMDLVLVASAEDINADRNRLMTILALAAVAIVVLFALAAVAVSRRFLRPLNELTEAASAVAAGNLDVSIPEGEATEVVTLVDAYKATVERMRGQMNVIEQMARTDGLTGLRNKVSYDEEMERLEGDIARGETQFGLVMIDANDLKGINDTYGHKRGDSYLCTAASAISHVFSGSYVYRIGGDEFVVLLEGTVALEGVGNKLEALELRAASSQVSGVEPWKQLSVAYGFAAFDAARDHSTSDVFARADAAMYAKKQSMKDGPRHL